MINMIRYLAATMAVMCVLSGCEWESSDGGDSWDSSYSWVNFSGMYKQTDGTRIVSGWNTGTTDSSSTNTTDGSTVSGTTGTSTQTIGTGGSNNRSFGGTLSTRPVLAGTVSVTDGVELLRDDGAGILTSTRAGRGTVNYSTGAISVIFELPPVSLAPIIATYSWSTTNAASSSTSTSTTTVNNQVTDKAIFSFYVSQTGNKLHITDNNSVEYGGELGGVANTGGESSGMSSGYIIAQFNAADAQGNKMVGTFQGDYIAPEVEASGATTASGLLANRTMQGTYMRGDGASNGDIYAAAVGSIEVVINPYTASNNTNTATTPTY